RACAASAAVRTSATTATPSRASRSGTLSRVSGPTIVMSPSLARPVGRRRRARSRLRAQAITAKGVPVSRYDVVIKDGMVFDGTGAPRVRADVGIAGGRIAAIGRIDAADADEVIDARGMHVAPGFVDLHTHYDAQVFWDPYLTLSGWHGVTS